MKKETLIIIFYVLYFSWLFTVTYLSPNTLIINLFTLFVVIFYFLFLKEEWDLIWFFVAASIAILVSNSFFSKIGDFKDKTIEKIPFWLPLAWGTTVLALRKFFILISKK